MNRKRRPYWLLFVILTLPFIIAACHEPEHVCFTESESGTLNGVGLSNDIDTMLNDLGPAADEVIINGDETSGSITLITSEDGVTITLQYSWNQINTDLWDVTVVARGDSPACEEEASVEPTAPALWLADVCEPLNGFSGDGWMTWSSDTSDALYVAASQEGPYYITEFVSPPFVMNEAHLNGLAGWMGVGDWHDLWFKVGEGGQEVHVGASVTERDGRMDAICSPE